MNAVKVDFFSASQNDAESRVTCNVTDLCNHPSFPLSLPQNGDLFIITVNYRKLNYDILFECNREEKTLKCSSWAHGLPTLVVGLRFSGAVVNIKKIATLQPVSTHNITFLSSKEKEMVKQALPLRKKGLSWPKIETILTHNGVVDENGKPFHNARICYLSLLAYPELKTN